MLYQASGVKYNKECVAYGKRMVTGAVPDTCEKHGMKAEFHNVTHSQKLLNNEHKN